MTKWLQQLLQYRVQGKNLSSLGANKYREGEGAQEVGLTEFLSEQSLP